MNFKEENVKSLIYKKILNDITPDEALLLRASEFVYTNEEFLNMYADVLFSIPKEDLPPSRLGDRPLDIEAIKAAGDKARAEKSRKNTFETNTSDDRFSWCKN